MPPAVSSFDACINLLSWVEEVPHNATGALTFDDGLVLVDKQRVCWAITSNMGVYLTDLLCESEWPNLPRSQIEDVYRRCKKSGLRLSEALLASGLISESRLRRALREHNSEAVVRLSHAKSAPRFRQLLRSGYDERFLLTPVELLASIGARGGEARADEASLELESALVEGAAGVAFAQDSPYDAPTVLAVSSHCALPVRQILALCRWATDFLSLGVIVDAATVLASATRGANTSIVTWRAEGVGYAALCANRVASAVLLDRIAKRVRASGGAIVGGGA